MADDTYCMVLCTQGVNTSHIMRTRGLETSVSLSQLLVSRQDLLPSRLIVWAASLQLQQFHDLHWGCVQCFRTCLRLGCLAFMIYDLLCLCTSL